MATLLADPYPAVRTIAYRSLRKLRGFEDFEYRTTGLPEERHAAATRAILRWRQIRKRTGQSVSGDELLLDAAGTLQSTTFNRLLSEQDPQVVQWAE